nr:hypothetical protein [Candidatus Njordarchaeota archaeon]
MNQISRDVEASLKSLYGDRWREGLVVFLLIGLGRSKMKRTPTPVSAYFQTLGMSEPANEPSDAIKELLENPFECLRLINEKAAKQLEIQLRNAPRAPFEDDLNASSETSET